MSAQSAGLEGTAELRRQLVRAVERTCPRWLSSEADDLVQNALIRVLEIRRRREGEAEFSSFYLRRAAYSAVVDEIRRRR
ncbi:MAG: sigma factor, partial [Thermoanaerobaculia bacterium]